MAGGLQPQQKLFDAWADVPDSRKLVCFRDRPVEITPHDVGLEAFGPLGDFCNFRFY